MNATYEPPEDNEKCLDMDIINYAVFGVIKLSE